jgi:uroporphyrinogen-III decarboxylase
MKYLKDLPKGKTVVHFEYIDIVNAKKELKDVACISGVYSAQLLTYGTKQQVIDEAKRLMDICAPGGGYIFDFDGGIYDCKRENLEALYDTIKTYGKYK